MESAIDQHLRCPRSLKRSIDEDYVPPFPAWVARADSNLEQVVMGYFGVQFDRAELYQQAFSRLAQIIDSFFVSKGPGHYDLAQFKDAAGYDNMIAIAYWDNPAHFDEWNLSPEVEHLWNDDEALPQDLGHFREILKPQIERFETAFSSVDRLEGIGVLMGGISEPIQEHAYWGSMRDRIPLAQTDALTPHGRLAASQPSSPTGRRVRVHGHENIAVIRSGQDWAETNGQERDLYLNEMQPTLAQGMDFLHEQGLTIQCYANRYMQHIDGTGKPLEKSFGLSFWRSLTDMEAWSKSHPTHVAIFGTFMRIVQELEGQLKLRLYHEVSVLTPEQQYYEYINCHPRTGLLNSLS